jgi:hypothetical protein
MLIWCASPSGRAWTMFLGASVCGYSGSRAKPASVTPADHHRLAVWQEADLGVLLDEVADGDFVALLVDSLKLGQPCCNLVVLQEGVRIARNGLRLLSALYARLYAWLALPSM